MKGRGRKGRREKEREGGREGGGREGGLTDVSKRRGKYIKKKDSGKGISLEN